MSAAKAKTAPEKDKSTPKADKAAAATAAVAATAFAALSDFPEVLTVLVGLSAGAPRSVSRRPK